MLSSRNTGLAAMAEWQTRQTQNLIMVTLCGFKSHWRQCRPLHKAKAGTYMYRSLIGIPKGSSSDLKSGLDLFLAIPAIKSILSLEYPQRLIKKSLFSRTFYLTEWVTVPPHWLSSGIWGAPHSPTQWNPRFLICIEHAPAHEEASNFCLSENCITKIQQRKHFRKTALLVLADKALL